MRALRTIAAIILSLALIILPLGAPLCVALLSPSEYSDSFVGILDEKYDRLNSIEGEKIVVVGGSSVAFGLDSERLESYTGMPVVNFGLYAALGTKLMLDLSLSGIGEGDIVIISPETDIQTMSLYFNADTTLKAMDGNFYMLRDVAVKNIPSLVGSVWNFSSEKLSLMRKEDGESSSDEIYLSKYFNEYGDFALYERRENVMPTYYDPNTAITLDKSHYESNSDVGEFIDYLGEYIAKCKKKGATVYYSYAPMNEMALSGSSTEENIAEFDEWLRRELDCPIIGEIDESILEAGYFFDTNFHLNDAGAFVRTLRLARALRLEHGIASGIIKDEEPKAPELPGYDVLFDGEDDNAKYFTFTLMDNGAYAISGLSELGKTMTSLTIPLGYDGKKVMSVYKGAFENSSLVSLTVTADTNLIRFENEAFKGASRLRDLWIHLPNADLIAPPIDFIGVHNAFRVHVPSDSNYSDHYYWGDRKLTFVFDA